MKVRLYEFSHEAADDAVFDDQPYQVMCEDWDPGMIYTVFPSRDFRMEREFRTDGDVLIDKALEGGTDGS